MSCNFENNLPSFFGPLSKDWQDLLKSVGVAAGSTAEGAKRYADTLFKEELATFKQKVQQSVDLLAKNAQESADRASTVSYTHLTLPTKA